MPKKIKMNLGKPGDEFLLPLTLEQSVNNLLYGDKVFGDGKMTYEEAKELVIKFREQHKEPKDA